MLISKKIQNKVFNFSACVIGAALLSACASQQPPQETGEWNTYNYNQAPAIGSKEASHDARAMDNETEDSFLFIP